VLLPSEEHGGNVIVHSVGTAHPFVGSGTRVGAFTMPPVDVSLPAEPDGPMPKPFTVADLHRYLETDGRRSLGIDGGDVTMVLCVRGDVATDVDGLVPDPAEPPGDRVSPDLVARVADGPTAVVRTYTRIIRRVGEGRAEVSLFVRFTLERDLLGMELASCVLRAPSSGYTLVPAFTDDLFDADLVPSGDRSASQAIGALATRLTLPTRRGRWRNHEIGDSLRERDRRDNDALRHGDPLDRGVPHTLRELVASTQSAHYFDSADVSDARNRLEHGVLRALRRFLADHGVDTTQLDDREKQIVNSHTYNIGTVGGVGHHIGSGGSTVAVGGQDRSA
jgi:hypothetical protein